MSHGLTALQDCETLKKGFTKLRDKYADSTARVSAAENELDACRRESEQLRAQVTALEQGRRESEQLRAQVTALQEGLRESEQLRTQVAALQEELRLQNETLQNRISTASSTAVAASQLVRIDVRRSRPSR